MNVLMISSDPHSGGAEHSLKAYQEVGFKVEVVRSVMDALEKSKKKKYALLVIERTAKSSNSDDDLFQVMQTVASLNPNAKVVSQGWQSTGLHYFISRDYNGNEYLDWVGFLKKIYIDLSLSNSNLN